jgi:hypothetical protein
VIDEAVIVPAMREVGPVKRGDITVADSTSTDISYRVLAMQREAFGSRAGGVTRS